MLKNQSNFVAYCNTSFQGRAPKDKGKDQQGLLKEREAAEGNCHTKYNESPIKMHETLRNHFTDVRTSTILNLLKPNKSRKIKREKKFLTLFSWRCWNKQSSVGRQDKGRCSSQ